MKSAEQWAEELVEASRGSVIDIVRVIGKIQQDARTELLEYLARLADSSWTIRYRKAGEFIVYRQAYSETLGIGESPVEALEKAYRTLTETTLPSPEEER